MWGLWWTKRHWGRFSPRTLVSPAKHSTYYSTLIIIHHHPELVQQDSSSNNNEDDNNNNNNNNNSVALVRERTVPTERPQFDGEVSANFSADRGCGVVSTTDPHCRILGFLDRTG
jgi:hypothetical protein